MTPTPRERATRLLRIHGGACSVPTGTALQAVFQIMELEGAVTTQPSSTKGFMDIYTKNFKPRYAGKGEK